MANRTFVRLGALTGACAALRIAAAVCIAGYYARVKPAVRASGRGRGVAKSNPRRVSPPEGREPPPVAADALNENTLRK